MIFDIIFIKIYWTKFPDPIYAAKVILIILQTLVMSSMIKVFIVQVFGIGYIDKLLENGNVKMIYLLSVILCSLFTHFLYTENRIEKLVTTQHPSTNFKNYSPRP